MYFTELGWESRDWINLVEVRDQWQALVNTVMNFMFFALCIVM
jgi:hypothetical protein